MASTLTDILYQLNQPITLPDINPALHKTKIMAKEASLVILEKTFPNTMMAYRGIPSKIRTQTEYYNHLDGITFDFTRAFIAIHLARCVIEFPEIYTYFQNMIK